MESVVKKLAAVSESQVCLLPEEIHLEPASVKDQSKAHYKGMGNLLRMKSSQDEDEDEDEEDERIDWFISIEEISAMTQNQ